MKRSVCFIGALRLTNCGSNNTNCPFHQKCNHFACSTMSIRGGTVSNGDTQLHAGLSATYASLVAGSIGGAIGVGVSYPFDTLSTKAQVTTGSDRLPHGLTGKITRVFKEEGALGFFEGVLLTMLGQALIKAIQFATIEITLTSLAKQSTISSDVTKLLISGIISGFISSFVVSPIELLKIRMQAQNRFTVNKKGNETHHLMYKNEIDCAEWVVKNEGWVSLFTHGLVITIIREIPSFAIYFSVYGLLARSSLNAVLGDHISSLLFGAVAGWAMWIPTYPIDIVKTIEQVQTREKKNEMLTWKQIAAELYRTGGTRAFFEGLEPKLARAGIKHAVTFWCYEVIMKILR